MNTGTRRAAAALGFALMLSAAGCPAAPSGGETAREKGAREAAAAVAAGTITIREYPPLPAPASHGEYIKLLRERCGVGYEVPSLPPGVAAADFLDEVRAWNGVMEAEVRRKHGDGIFDELRAAARQRWEEKIKPAGKE